MMKLSRVMFVEFKYNPQSFLQPEGVFLWTSTIWRPKDQQIFELPCWKDNMDHL